MRTWNLLSQAAAARRLGINRITLHRDLAREHRLYPEPAAEVDGHPVYDANQINQWTQRKEKR